MRMPLRWIATLSVVLMPALASAQDKLFDSHGVQIRYIDQGAGEPVVLIHGYTSNIERAWIATGVLSNLTKDHRVIALDSRGHGKSGKPTDPKAYGEEMGQDVVRLLDHLNLPRAHIVGYSLGAIITAKLLTTNPGRFISATLSGHSGVRSWGAQDEQAAEAAAVELEGGTPFRSLILAIAPTDQPRPTEEAIRARSRELVAGNDPIALAAYNRGRRGLATTNVQMATIGVPTIGVIGGADAFLVGMKELKVLLPALTVVVIDGATHSGERAATRRPEYVNAIREFIAAHRSTSSK